MQRLAQDAAEVVELQEEVTLAQAAAIMEQARTTQAESVAKERVVLLAITHREVDEMAQRVSFLDGEIVVARCTRERLKRSSQAWLLRQLLLMGDG
jgi:hypothetical protein